MKRMIDSELIEALGTDIKFDENGNVTIGKNLDVGGTTKLNGGFEPIYSYDDAAGNAFDIYSERDSGEGYTFLGALNYGNIGIGYYTLDNSDKIDTINFLQMGPDGLSVYIGHDDYEKFINLYELTDELNKKQNKLYRHKITLNGIYVLMYNSTSNLKVNSVADLRTIMKISSTTPNEEILPVCASDATSMVTLVVTSSLCQVDGSDVTSVSDTVTPL